MEKSPGGYGEVAPACEWTGMIELYTSLIIIIYFRTSLGSVEPAGRIVRTVCLSMELDQRPTVLL